MMRSSSSVLITPLRCCSIWACLALACSTRLAQLGLLGWESGRSSLTACSQMARALARRSAYSFLVVSMVHGGLLPDRGSVRHDMCPW